MKNRLLLTISFSAIVFSAIVNSVFSQGDFWITKTGMPTPRSCPESGVIDGRLYVVDGQPPSGFSPSVFEEYDPTADACKTKAPRLLARSLDAAPAAAGKLFVVGIASRFCESVDCILWRLG